MSRCHIFFINMCVAYIPRMVGVHSVRRRGRFISPVYVCCCFVVGSSLFLCMFVSFSGCECICGHDKSAPTVGVRSVYGGCLWRIRLVFVAYMVGICSVYSWYWSAILHRIFYEMCCVHSTNGWCTFR